VYGAAALAPGRTKITKLPCASEVALQVVVAGVTTGVADGQLEARVGEVYVVAKSVQGVPPVAG